MKQEFQFWKRNPEVPFVFLSLIVIAILSMTSCTSADVKSVRKQLKEEDKYIQEMYKQNPGLFEAAQVLSQ